MATLSKLRSVHTTLTGTTVDTVNLLQQWDGIEISNRGTVSLYVTFNGDVPTSGGDNTDIVEAGVTKLFPAFIRPGALNNSASFPCHSVQLIGSANPYSVMGVAGQ